jgi:Transposase DDE domain
VADSAYGTYADLALVQASHADAVFRKHHARHCDFRRGKRFATGDHLVQWQRPAQCPKAMTQAEYEALPASLAVREVRFSISTPGLRPKVIILVTSLLDPKAYPKAQLAMLYRLRWQATEVNFRYLKTTLQMEMIAAKTPDMVQKDIYMHLLAYNLLRTLMWQAAQTHQQSPLQISLQATRQSFNQFQPLLAQVAQTAHPSFYRTLKSIIATLLIPERPNRAEPRVVKRRPKPFPRMQQPRRSLKAQLIN